MSINREKDPRFRSGYSMYEEKSSSLSGILSGGLFLIVFAAIIAGIAYYFHPEWFGQAQKTDVTLVEVDEMGRITQVSPSMVQPLPPKTPPAVVPQPETSTPLAPSENTAPVKTTAAEPAQTTVSKTPATVAEPVVPEEKPVDTATTEPKTSTEPIESTPEIAPVVAPAEPMATAIEPAKPAVEATTTQPEAVAKPSETATTVVEQPVETTEKPAETETVTPTEPVASIEPEKIEPTKAVETVAAKTATESKPIENPAETVTKAVAQTPEVEPVKTEPEKAEPAKPTLAEQVASLQAQAYAQLKGLRLTSPTGDNAYETYQTLVKLSPKEAYGVRDQIQAAYLAMAQAKLQANKVNDAQEILAKMKEINSRDDDVRALERALKKASANDEVDSLYAQGRRMAQRNQLQGKDGAIRQYQLLSARAPRHDKTRDLADLILRAYENTADKQIKDEKYSTPAGDNAVDTYRDMLKFSPNNSAAKQGLAKIVGVYEAMARQKMQEGKWVISERLVQRGLSILPKDPDLNALAKELRKQKAQMPKPKPVENDKITAPANSLAAQLQQAQRQMQANQLTSPPNDNALESYQAILQKNPDNNEAKAGLDRIAQSYIKKARTLKDQGQSQQAMSVLSEALAIFPDNTAIANLREEVLKAWQ